MTISLDDLFLLIGLDLALTIIFLFFPPPIKRK
jgi:hypothetical protein